MKSILKVNRDTENSEFYESKRLFATAMIDILNRKGSTKVRTYLKAYFDDTTLSAFPENFTAENLRNTIMNLIQEEIKFK